MKKKLLNWFTDFLYPWFIPAEDYACVQSARWAADETARRLNERYAEAIDSLYERKYKPFERLSEAAVVTEEAFDSMDLRALELRWAIRIPHHRFVTMIDPSKERDHIRRVVTERLAEGFKDYILKQLFNQQERAEQHANAIS